MEEKKQRLVIDGNAIYELDLECLKRKKEQEVHYKTEKQENRKKRQRG